MRHIVKVHLKKASPLSITHDSGNKSQHPRQNEKKEWLGRRELLLVGGFSFHFGKYQILSIPSMIRSLFGEYKLSNVGNHFEFFSGRWFCPLDFYLMNQLNKSTPNPLPPCWFGCQNAIRSCWRKRGDVLVWCLDKEKYPKWWFDGDLPWYKVQSEKITLNKSKRLVFFWNPTY